MRFLSYLQRIGQALMVPIATLPAAAILIGIGYWIDPAGNGANSPLAAFLFQSGSAIINNMAALFAVGVAYGLSRDKNGAAALAGFVGFLVVTTLCSPNVVSMIERIPLKEVPDAFNNINTQFIGILVGVIAAEIYNRFSQVELPSALSFFSGRRLVPILTSFVMILLSFILMYVWPAIAGALVSFGKEIQSLGSVGAGIYAFLNRLLIPVGLHHVLNSVFWFNVAGINDIPNFLGGQNSINAGTAIVGITGRYQAGFFPIMMFGLPGAALAIYQCAKPENKKKVAGIMLAAAFASFFTGVTEPLEFSFMFVAPVLYFIHALLTGLSVYIAAAMHWISGFGFSAGVLDLILQSHNPLAHQWYMLIPQGIVFFLIYYTLFRFVILKFDLKTPGRENDDLNDVTADVNTKEDKDTLARQYIAAIGGSDNLVNIDSCITRLRLSVKDSTRVNNAAAGRLGASGVIRLNKESVQVIVGTKAESIADAMRKIVNSGAVVAAAGIAAADVTTNVKPKQIQHPVKKLANDKKNQVTVEQIMAPITGKVVSLDKVPDEVFSSKAVGDGLAILPTDEQVLAPANGTIVKIYNTNHAFALETEQGAEIIVHVGIDTVKLEGMGFKRLVEEGASVKIGTPILQLDLAYLKAHVSSMLTPVVVSNIDDYHKLAILAKKQVIAGETPLFELKK